MFFSSKKQNLLFFFWGGEEKTIQFDYFIGFNEEGKSTTLRIRTPPMKTPDPHNDTPGTLKQVVLSFDTPWHPKDS